MYFKNILFSAVILVSFSHVYAEGTKPVPKAAEPQASSQNKASSKEKIVVQAKGMVCAFCAQGVEKKFKKLSQVEDIKVSLETKKIDIGVKEGATVTDDEIKKILTESGYELVKIERTK